MAGLLLGGVKESKVITNYFTAFKVAFVAFMTSMAFGLMDPKNLTPFVPPEFGANGVLQGATASFFGFLGYDEVCCLTAEAIDPQKNMPRAILWTIAILTVSYMTATLALTGMQPYDEISAVEGFPGAFRSRDADFAANMAALGAIVTLPLVVLVAVMAQPRLQYALASDGLIPAWFGQVDETGNLWNGTLFAGVVMTLIASFVPFEHLNDMISAGVLVAFSMTNSSLILLRHESPDETPFLLEKLLASFNGLAFLASLLMSTPFFASIIGKTVAFTCCLLALLACVLIKLKCPAAAYFGGKTRRTTTQHMTVGVVSVEEEEFRTPFLPFFPCLGIFMNWYLVAQQSWSGLGLLILFLVCAILFYFSYGYYYSVGNNGGWDAYQWCDDDGFVVVMDPVAEHESESSDGNNSSTVGLPIDKEITLSLMPPLRPVATGRFEP
jgi:APA family basic amino acid/polyamine antiporter